MDPVVQPTSSVEESRDPADWGALTSLGHRMVDDRLDSLRTVRRELSNAHR